MAYPARSWRVVERSPNDGRFLVEVPDLPGCMADGGSPGEAVANAEVVIRGWSEAAGLLGRPIPEPEAE